MKAKIKHVRTTFGLLGMGCLAIVLLVTTRTTAAPKGANMKADAPVALPDIIAVRFRHDMCPYCKRFDPQVPKLIRRANDESVLFITLDMTSETTQKQAALLVGALGLEHVWPGDLSKIGSITFVDGNSKQVLSSLIAEDLKTVQLALRDAQDSSRSAR